MSRMRMILPVLVLAFLLTACGEESAPATAWAPVEPAAMTETQRAQQDKGIAAKDALFATLFARLQQAFGDGPGAAIGACQIAAPEIAAAVADEHDLRIGRTSHKLRNPNNVAPAWAAEYVHAQRATPLWLAGDDGRLAGLLPIPTKGLCLMCHGPADALATPIRTALAERYPQDQATGFAKGDLRGWFWLEIPAPKD